MSLPDEQRVRRALVVGDAAAGPVEENLAACGYETLRATTVEAPRAAERFAPDVALLAVGEGDGESARAAELVRRLRTDARSFALPIFILFREDSRELRQAALAAGVDDYFPLAAAPDELRARLDALFWRAEAGRRAAPAALDRHSEIDNFLLLLDAVRADAEGGAAGTLALVGASREGGEGVERLMNEAYGFFKLNLRRADAVAFYGPTILLAYLPGRAPAEARAILAGMCDAFKKSRPGGGVTVGLASFPEDGCDVERLVEEAEARLEAARARGPRPGGVASDAAVIKARPVAPASAGREEIRVGPAQRDDGGGASGSAQAGEKASAGSSPAPDVAGRARQDSTHDEKLARESRMLDALEASTASLAHAGARTESRTRAGRGPRRLLLTISDAARMAQLNLLIRSAGYEVRAAFDGRQALSLLRIERPDLLLVDYELRDMDGVEMLRLLRKQQGGRLVRPAILLLPEGHVEAGREALEIGARGVVTLPYNPDELLDSIRGAAAE